MPDGSTGKKQRIPIVVFPDMETWNTLDGCIIKVLDEDQFEDLCHDRVDAGDIVTEIEVSIKDIFIASTE